MVGGIATDYLRFQKDGDEYRYFVGGFIGGDVLGYIVATVGVELLLAWFTGGIGTIVSAMGKLGRVGAIAGRAVQFLGRLLAFFRRIEDLIGDFMAVVGRTVKNGL